MGSRCPLCSFNDSNKKFLAIASSEGCTGERLRVSALQARPDPAVGGNSAHFAGSKVLLRTGRPPPESTSGRGCPGSRHLLLGLLVAPSSKGAREAVPGAEWGRIGTPPRALAGIPSRKPDLRGGRRGLAGVGPGLMELKTLGEQRRSSVVLRVWLPSAPSCPWRPTDRRTDLCAVRGSLQWRARPGAGLRRRWAPRLACGDALRSSGPIGGVPAPPRAFPQVRFEPADPRPARARSWKPPGGLGALGAVSAGSPPTSCPK